MTLQCPVMRWVADEWEQPFGVELLAAMNAMKRDVNQAAFLALTQDIEQGWVTRRTAALQATHTALWAEHCGDAAAAWLPHLVEARLAYTDDPCVTGDGSGDGCAALAELQSGVAAPALPQPDDHEALAALRDASPALWAHTIVAIAAEWELVATAAHNDALDAAEALG